MQGLYAAHVSGIRGKAGIKKAPPRWGLPGGQRAGNHPSPRSVNVLGQKDEGGEGVEQEEAEACGDGGDGEDQGPAYNRY